MTTRDEQDAVDDIVGQWGHERPDMDVSALQVFGRLHRAYLLYQTSLSSLFSDYDLNMASFDVLASLRRNGAPYRMTSGELAKTMLVTTGGVTLRVDRLEKAGLVERKRDPDDRRIVYVCLTTTGLSLIDQTASAHFANELRLLQGLDEADQRALSTLLQKLETSIIDAEAEGEAHSA
ncbi:MarR family winged helix-turn-helix transcriptional regulator [Gordonia hydrophobica]|uniref:MarR family transcriptional regulator n=1 Tax=Gordonia hydrophobica TaxID=40516 RepID=A0ABZ2U6N3_9ACTN|nr:MarR family transcriptional regulator [Gordonia hydrophobica]MBM7365690.1 DNA-binding MarR family transcriptional regulator [Gordonia hydrophobica]